MTRDLFGDTARLYTRTNPLQYLHQLFPFFHEKQIFRTLWTIQLYVCGKKLDSISNKIVKETNAAIKCLKNNDWEQIHQNFN